VLWGALATLVVSHAARTAMRSLEWRSAEALFRRYTAQARERERSGCGGLTREVETPLPSTSPRDHMILSEEPWSDSQLSHRCHMGALRSGARDNPGNYKMHYSLAVSLGRGARAAEAEAGYVESVRLNPEHADGLNNLCLLLAGQRRHAEAEAACRRAIAVQPTHAKAMSNLGMALQVRVLPHRFSPPI
jgi:tetratricopeptide (TPR) repeat protein